jgi:hypothetical protein
MEHVIFVQCALKRNAALYGAFTAGGLFLHVLIDTHVTLLILAFALYFRYSRFTVSANVHSSQTASHHLDAAFLLGKANGFGSLQAVEGLNLQTPRYFLPKI